MNTGDVVICERRKSGGALVLDTACVRILKVRALGHVAVFLVEDLERTWIGAASKTPGRRIPLVCTAFKSVVNNAERIKAVDTLGFDCYKPAPEEPMIQSAV